MITRCVAVVLTLGALGLVACNGDDSTTSTTSTSRAKESATKCAGCPTYGESDTAITAAPGDEFVIELESNSSTGYEWTATISDPAVVRAVADEYVDPDTDLVGAPGQQRFVFEPVAAGSATIVLRYARSFEPDDPSAREVTYTVTVT
jgi:inhibitor of cysteine peptidase